jgi:LPXTG-motif cell wall-anchored protein
MLKTRVAFVALLAGLLSTFAASAANAAYAPPPFTAEIPDGVGPGEEFTITFDAGNINCAWSLKTFHGQKAPDGSGTTYSVTLIAPKGNGDYTITARCAWDPETVNPAVAPATTSNTVTPAVFSTSTDTSSDTLLAVPQTDTYSVQLVVGDGGEESNGDDDAADESGALPNTGGSNLTLLAAGAGLVVVGAGVTIAARRRKTA